VAGPAGESDVDEADDDPHRLARANLERYRERGRDLRNWRGEWYQYKGTHYQRISTSGLRNRITAAIKSELDRTWIERIERQGDDDTPPVRKVTTRLLTDVVQATAGLTYLKDSTEHGSWIGEGPPNCIAMQNGILCLSELFKSAGERDDNKILLPHSTNWFSTVCLPYGFDHEAQCPRWQEFLLDVFNGDQASITALQQWFGYLLLPDTSLHKMMFIIGQPRSGKGTIMRTLINLVGRNSVASPTLNDLAGNFSLQGLTDKTIAVIPDARLSQRADETTITEKILSITGEDPQDIQRKHMETLHAVRLQVRFTLFSNQLPTLKDTSAALMTRGLFLLMPNCYEGREDRNLGSDLEAELPGILNWAIVGRYQLQEAGRIQQPQMGRSLLSQMKMLSAPLTSFLDEHCTIGPNEECEVSLLYERYEEWCESNDVDRKFSKQRFGKELRDASPNISVIRKKIAGVRERWYGGISISK
ncbi:MAG: phage/plasmid primase, P4 family, partial [Planctomycetota bacterium]